MDILTRSVAKCIARIPSTTQTRRLVNVSPLMSVLAGDGPLALQQAVSYEPRCIIGERHTDNDRGGSSQSHSHERFFQVSILSLTFSILRLGRFIFL